MGVVECDPRVERYAEALAQQGVPVIVRRPDAGTYNPATRRLAQGGPVFEVETSGVIENFRTGEIDGTSIRVGDLRITIPAATLPEPIMPGDEIEYAGNPWKVLAAEPQVIAGAIAAHRAQIRK